MQALNLRIRPSKKKEPRTRIAYRGSRLVREAELDLRRALRALVVRGYGVTQARHSLPLLLQVRTKTSCAYGGGGEI